MPIRFRCAYCSQLMGIARRKAGSVVSCPKCQGKVIVPNPEAETTPVPAVNGPQFQAPTKGPGGLFEQSDFDNMLAPNPGDPPFLAGAQPAPLPDAVDVEPLGSPEMLGPGIFLTPNKLTALSVAVVILLGVAFFIGVLVGRP
jgi:DNA-directed RNA polymerase subunit RPC12/RpoP